MGERMRQGKARVRAQRKGDGAGREWREEAKEREGVGVGVGAGERPLSRSWWKLPAGLTARERSAVIQALEEGMRLLAEQMERGLREGQAGWWLVDQVRALGGEESVRDRRGRGADGEGRERGRSGEKEALTRRELEVLGMAARGMKGPEIARTLSLSKDTVHTHQARTCAKLGVSGTAAAVAKARELGLI